MTGSSLPLQSSIVYSTIAIVKFPQYLIQELHGSLMEPLEKSLSEYQGPPIETLETTVDDINPALYTLRTLSYGNWV